MKQKDLDLVTWGKCMYHQCSTIEELLLKVLNMCEVHGVSTHRAYDICIEVGVYATQSNDCKAGIRDCKAGIYDKWYRYNRDDDGAAYDKGWMQQNKTTQCEVVTFLNA